MVYRVIIELKLNSMLGMAIVAREWMDEQLSIVNAWKAQWLHHGWMAGWVAGELDGCSLEDSMMRWWIRRLEHGQAM